MRDRPFLGRGWGFPPEFDSTSRGVRMVVGEEDIDESLRILFTTLAGERVMRPDYGGGMDRHVFARMDATVTTMLTGAIRDAVLHFEPRIALEDIEVDTSGEIDGRLLFELRYRVISTNTRNNVVFPFYLSEGTSLSPR
jgi:phage baseplate assembly protein W